MLFKGILIGFWRNKEGDYKERRLNAFIETQLESYDVICPQEMFQFASFRRSKLIWKAREKGKYHSAAPTEFIDGGLLILSRFPIRSCAFKYSPE